MPIVAMKTAAPKVTKPKAMKKATKKGSKKDTLTTTTPIVATKTAAPKVSKPKAMKKAKQKVSRAEKNRLQRWHREFENAHYKVVCAWELIVDAGQLLDSALHAL